MGQSLLMGVEGASIFTGSFEVFGGSLFIACILIMMRNTASKSTLTITASTVDQYLCDTTMQQAAAGKASLFVDQSTKLFMAKVVGQSPITCTAPHLFDNALGHQFFQGNDRLFLTTATGLTEGIKIEGASNDGGGVEQLPACLTDI